MGTRQVDLKLISEDAIYRDDAGTEHQVEWVTQQDLDLARRISEIAAAVAAGAVIVDDSRAPSTTVLADPDGNKACVGVFQQAAGPASTGNGE
jgi:Glyoxalase-like domain